VLASTKSVGKEGGVIPEGGTGKAGNGTVKDPKGNKKSGGKKERTKGRKTFEKGIVALEDYGTGVKKDSIRAAIPRGGKKRKCTIPRLPWTPTGLEWGV